MDLLTGETELEARLAGLSRDFALVLLSSLARLGLGFVTSVILARVLGPADYGILIVLSALIAVGHVVVDLGLSNAAVRHIAERLVVQLEAAVATGRVFFWLRVGLVLIFLGVMATVLMPVSHLLQLGGHETALALALVGMLGTVMSGSVSALLQACGRFGRISLLVLTNGSLSLVLAVVLAGWNRLTLESALLSLGLVTSLATLGVGVRWLPRSWNLAPPSAKELRRYAPPLVRFGGWLWIGNCLAVVASRLDLLLIQQWSTPAVVGVYALAVSLVSKAGILNSSLITVLLPSVSALKGRSEIWRYLRHGLPRSAIIALGFVAMVPIVGPFVGLVYGSTYAASVTLIKWLMVIAAFEIAVAPLLVLVYPLDKPRLAAQADGLRIGVLVALGVLLTPVIGPIGLVIARLFASVSGAGFVIVQLLRTGWIRPQAKAEIR